MELSTTIFGGANGNTQTIVSTAEQMRIDLKNLGPNEVTLTGNGVVGGTIVVPPSSSITLGVPTNNKKVDAQVAANEVATLVWQSAILE